MLSLPPLAGLVLAGGASSRMGVDKSQIEWHGKPQWVHLKELMETLGLQAFVSVAKAPSEADYFLEDLHANIGPMGGIYTAMKRHPQQAWLVVACDLPLVDREVLEWLISFRKREISSVSCIGPGNFPEPLFSIWEPELLPVLDAKIEQKNYRLSGALEWGNALHPVCPWPEKLSNINTPDDRQKIQQNMRFNKYN